MGYVGGVAALLRSGDSDSEAHGTSAVIAAAQMHGKWKRTVHTRCGTSDTPCGVLVGALDGPEEAAVVRVDESRLT